MPKYYIFKIEQIYKENDYAEYCGSEKINDEQAAYTKYYKYLSDVSSDIGKNHTYMYIAVIDSFGNIKKEDRAGKYVMK